MEPNDPQTSLLLVTPPFTQLNTPYPATAFLKGFFNTKGIKTHQFDLGIEVISHLFSTEGFMLLFQEIEKHAGTLSSHAKRMVHLQDSYIQTIAPVMGFLRGKNPGISHLICSGEWLPEGGRFEQLTNLDRDFGHLGLHDKAKYLATCYLEDVSDLIVETIDPHFGFSRYAERLGRSAATFDLLERELNIDQPEPLIDRLMTSLLRQKIEETRPAAVAFTVPFPGNLFCALKCGQWLKKHHPEIRVLMGGGFANTELRSLSDARVFRYLDYITLDDGEIPLLHLLEHFQGKRPMQELMRTFALSEGIVTYFNGSHEHDAEPHETGTPDYSGLPLEKYVSVLEMANPMHRLWSDGRWNKLMLAHGCYWAKCSFCDVSLDYIQRFQPNTAAILCDRMEIIMAQTEQNGFHFTDEAAPPVLLRDLALEIIRRKLTVTWWTNIRFEKKFTADLCRLLKASGCIAVSGGLEVASDRILKMINKGVTVPQVATVAGNFTNAGIMVHAYLMYGFPTQTEQETIDSLEVVRQLFLNGVIRSGFWHQFAMTAHSPVGLHPEQFGVAKENHPEGSFANNDLIPIDLTGCNHETFSAGLKKSLYNFMHGICFDFPLQEWFDFRVPKTTIAPQFIRHTLTPQSHEIPGPDAKVVWLGVVPAIEFYTRIKKGKSSPAVRLTIDTVQTSTVIRVNEATGKWLVEILSKAAVAPQPLMTFREFEESYISLKLGDFRIFRDGEVLSILRANGLLIL